MLYLAFIFHMHQPYYKNLLTQETDAPWVRLHGSKDYLDMVEILEKYPDIHQTFNLVPSLIEQIEDYNNHQIKDKFLELSYKQACELNTQEKTFILNNFFSINKDTVIAYFPRYYELYFKKMAKSQFSVQDFLDLQVLFNLSWIDPKFRENNPELKKLTAKARFFSEEEKQTALNEQLKILTRIIPAYKKFIQKGQIEVTVNPYYHPILPLLYNTRIAKEANLKTPLPKINFSYPEDAKAQIDSAVSFYKERFGIAPCGMWPSEEAVSDHILPFIICAGINWIVADEGILFKSLKSKKRDTRLLYQPHFVEKEEGKLNIVFRDRNLSDLIGFTYHKWKTESAVNDLIKHMENIHNEFKNRDALVTLAMDGENAWEYYPNDGHDFLELLYQKLSESKVIKTVTVSEYLKKFPARSKIKRLGAGSWIYTEFGKWIGSPQKVKAWEWLAEAREEMEKAIKSGNKEAGTGKALKQMQILEGSDWFWWAGEDVVDGFFEKLFRMHLINFYTILGKEIPDYLKE